jgi:membrane protein DedA with SNARE-associated domain
VTGSDLGGTAGWVVDVISSIGVLGVGALITLENVFPPIPSEVILAFAGFSAAQGVLSAPLAWVAATAGSLLGAYVLYAVGALVGYERLHELAGRRWFVLFTQTDLRRGERFFARHGTKVVLLARMIPLLRSVVSVPAGITRMPLGRFTALTALGSGVWNAAFIYAGYRLGDRWEDAAQYLQPVAYVVVAALLVALTALVVRTVRRRRAQRS